MSVGPHLAQRSADQLAGLVGDAEVPAADVGDDDAVAAHDECEVGQRLENGIVDLGHGVSVS